MIRWVLCGDDDDDDNPKHMQIHVNFVVQKVWANTLKHKLYGVRRLNEHPKIFMH